MVVRTVAKHRYFSGKRAKRSATEYTNYVTYRRGEDREQGGRKFFDDERDDIRGREVKDRIRDFEQGRGVAVHELILSPGLNVVDPQEYTRELMEKLEHSKGQELPWVAVAHRGNHNHIHVLVLGKDEEGRPVKINRHDYKDLRQWGDKYLEREHDLDRYLEREPVYDRGLDLEKVEERQRGDDLFNSLFGKGTKEKEQDREGKKEKEWDKEKAVAELSDKEKIYRQNEAYSRFSTLDQLKDLDMALMAGVEERVSKQEYAQLQRWIDEKKKYGDDYHEKQEKEKLKQKGKEKERDGDSTDRYVREFKELTQRAKEFERPSDLGRRKMGRQQYIQEQRGRKDLLDSHSTYQFNMAEQRLKDAMERDPTNKEQYERELSSLRESHNKELEFYQKPVDLNKLFGWKEQEKERQDDKQKGEKPKEKEPDERDPDKDARERQERDERERRAREARERDERGDR